MFSLFTVYPSGDDARRLECTSGCSETHTNACKRHVNVDMLLPLGYSLIVLSYKSRKQPTMSPILYLVPKLSEPPKWTFNA